MLSSEKRGGSPFSLISELDAANCPGDCEKTNT